MMEITAIVIYKCTLWYASFMDGDRMQENVLVLLVRKYKLTFIYFLEGPFSPSLATGTLVHPWTAVPSRHHGAQTILGGATNLERPVRVMASA